MNDKSFILTLDIGRERSLIRICPVCHSASTFLDISPYSKNILFRFYCNDSMFSNSIIWVNSVDQDETAPLPLKEQSDQGLHCSLLCLHLLDTIEYGKTTLFLSRVKTAIFSGIRIFFIFTAE